MNTKNPTLAPKSNFFARIFNVAPHEAPRITFAWLLRFLVQMGWTIGWTMLTAMFVNRLGIELLPLLFVANAGLVILGTVLFSQIIHTFGRRVVIIGTLISGAVLFISALLAFNATESLRWFFGLALVAESIFFAQLGILLSLFIEELFSPLESERALPLVESAEYVGGIAGGLLILAGIDLLHLEAPQLSWLRVAVAALILPAVIVFYYRQRKLPTLAISKPKNHNLSKLDKIGEGAQHIRSIPFLRTLLLVVLFQWTFFTLLNFQYTKAVDANVQHGATTESVQAESDQTAATSSEHSAASAYPAGSEPTHGAAAHGGHEDLLTHGLGILHIAFSVLALLVQLFCNSRLLERLGIVRTMSLHPLATLATTSLLTFKFGFFTAVAAKAQFETTTGTWTSAYLASFYALRESVREHAKEFLEGLVRPMGAVLGTGLIFGLQHYFHSEQLTLAINLAMLMTMGGMAALLLRARSHYTHVSKKNLELFGDHPAKYDSVEILAQSGHENAADILIKNLLYKKESEQLRIKILETLGRICDPKTIPEILACFDDPSPAIKLAAVRTLGKFKDLGAHFFTQAFTRFRVITALKELFAKEDSKELRSAIVHVFANMHQAEVIPFLVEALAKSSNEVKADCIFVCGLFHDVSAAHYIEPHLRSEDPYIKVNAIISLWQFPQYRLKLTIQLAGLLEAEDKPTQLAVIHMLGEIGAIQEKPRLLKYLEHTDPELRLLAALALAKLKHASVPEILADFALHADPALAQTAKKHLRNLPLEIQKKVDDLIHQKLGDKLNQALTGLRASSLSELPPTKLDELRGLYAAAEEWHEVAKIDAALAGKDFD